MVRHSAFCEVDFQLETSVGAHIEFFYSLNVGDDRRTTGAAKRPSDVVCPRRATCWTATRSLGLFLSTLRANRELEHCFRNGAEERSRILFKEVIAVLEHALDVQ